MNLKGLMSQEDNMSNKPRSFWSTPTGWTALGLIAAVSYFLLVEHRQHIFEYLPYLIFLACPLMHVFMHGSHGKHEHDESNFHEKESPETSKS